MQAALDEAKRKAYSFLTPFFGPLNPAERLALHQQLEPTAADYNRVFVANAVASARAAYAPLWSAMQPFIIGPPDAVLSVHAAEARSFATPNDQSREFPGGYAQIAELLIPDIIWLGFRVVAPGESSGTSYDGLVSLDDRFVMFPKAFRYVRPSGTDQISEPWSK